MLKALETGAGEERFLRTSYAVEARLVHSLSNTFPQDAALSIMERILESSASAESDTNWHAVRTVQLGTVESALSSDIVRGELLGRTNVHARTPVFLAVWFCPSEVPKEPADGVLWSNIPRTRATKLVRAFVEVPLETRAIEVGNDVTVNLTTFSRSCFSPCALKAVTSSGATTLEVRRRLRWSHAQWDFTERWTGDTPSSCEEAFATTAPHREALVRVPNAASVLQTRFRSDRVAFGTNILAKALSIVLPKKLAVSRATSLVAGEDVEAHRGSAWSRHSASAGVDSLYSRMMHGGVV
jgi:hypothetical protein